jgi:hypothetical protein
MCARLMVHWPTVVQKIFAKKIIFQYVKLLEKLYMCMFTCSASLLRVVKVVLKVGFDLF